ncbi:MAG TPA: Ig-like domain-containing protein [Bacteroidales bacterium]|jgi:hypothetical protein|nr:Ig-like domain-containing protein [Bacteroidales bacterium]HNQ59919.1 Ig-like domain-containing protein [Bacteroidales bacterium]HNU21461.1 Ig-like domain-containing protein [Bacteroidales bacterium]HNV17094.1 Ig-like domain-containing protein [Bacteroidales bacterium]HNZ79280.1 Ig-like domain-containing protein [Bacteroidales bacterium]
MESRRYFIRILKKAIDNAMLALGLGLLLLMCHCANPVVPQGGPKDTDPPKLLYAVPPNLSTHFTASHIKLTFDEYVVLKEINKKFLMSPPSLNLPEFKVKGKSLEIDLKDTLRPNTTYSLYFADAITDLHENNPLPDFQYVFSTGAVIDSLTMTGSVVNAFNLKPVENMVVMLYYANNDTLPLEQLPLKVPPSYAARTRKDGSFNLNYLRDEKYLLFALIDQNYNYFFDLAEEEIAFSDTLVRAFYIPPAPDTSFVPKLAVSMPDSLLHDTIAHQELKDSIQHMLFQDTLRQIQHLRDTNDTAPSDTLAKVVSQTKEYFSSLPDTLAKNDSTVVRQPHLSFVSYRLFSFVEEDTVQRLLRRENTGNGQIFLNFKRSIEDFSYRLLPPFDSLYQPLLEINRNQDSIKLWFPSCPFDSVKICIYTTGIQPDTLVLPLKRETIGTRSKKTKTESLMVETLSGQTDAFKPFILKFNHPVDSVKSDSLLLFTSKDTLWVKFEFADSLKRKALVKYSLDYNSSYQLIIPSKTFVDIFGLANDSITARFTTRAADAYGSFHLKLISPASNNQYLIQLLDEKENLVRQDIINDLVCEIDYGMLLPKKFILKAVLDCNRNRKWDTGNYRKKRQPEKVQYFKAPIEIRANWDLREEWILE